ncbi:AIPR family protein [Telluribacter sp.]|jgi:hypothetical protein|uniref:AIPR family protein n=1 Tax=Telluribacter sp. TaxID=1978767 RepID=UPI002E125FE2|nr:AIPR family protein [Telluribacter sp.]
MTLEEFAADFFENVLISAESDGLSLEDVITNDVLEYIKDCGEALEPQLCSLKARGLKINAIDYDDDNESIDLFITISREVSGVQKIPDREIIDAFSKAEKFFIAARDGTISDKIEEPDEHLSDFINIIQQTKTYVRNVRVFVLTNGLCSAHIVPKDKGEDNITWDYELWDIERVYQQYLIKSGKQKIEIDFERDYNFKLKCLQMDNVSDKVDEYLTILPAGILSDIYGQYKQGLLEKNVRTFLQFKTKVNSGIRETIRTQPDMFFAYNNGISTTAENVEVSHDGGVAYLSRIENLQIVNGGQTTASIYYTSNEKDIDLSKVFVPMKISVVKTGNSLNDIVPQISQFANSQTAIKASDFSSNSPYHVSIERCSRTIWIPESNGGKSVSKWYYERTRGQYLDERSRIPSKKDQKLFDAEHPKKYKFTKTDLAKYEMCWRQRPHDVSKGGEKNYLLFLKETDQNAELTKSEYERLLAKAILFKETDKLVTKKKLAGYKANVVTYTVSLLSHKSGQKLNLDKIWQQQKLNEELQSFIAKLIDTVWIHITQPPKQGMNVTEWCKRLECWNTLKDKYVDASILNDQLVNTGQEGKLLSEQQVKIIESASSIKGAIWFALAKWAKANSQLSPFDRKLAYNLGVLHNRGTKLSPKQADNAMRIRREAQEKGFIPEE